MSDRFATYDAAYLLGALTPPDRSEYEAHLAECPDCRRAVGQLAGMPGLLAALTLDEARAAGEPGPELPETLLPRLMAEVQRTRFRRRMTTALVGVAAAAVLAIALVVGIQGSRDETGDTATPPAVAQRMVALSPDVPIRATARLYDQDWGTRIVVTCIYRGGHEWPDELPYTMVVVDKSGAVQHISSWEAKAGAPIVVDGSTSVARSQIASVQVRTSNDTPILTLKL
jgi:hypothetical protein